MLTMENKAVLIKRLKIHRRALRWRNISKKIKMEILSENLESRENDITVKANRLSTYQVNNAEIIRQE